MTTLGYANGPGARGSDRPALTQEQAMAYVLKSAGMTAEQYAAQKAALEAGQIDAIVVDLPTALYLSAVEIEGSSVIGQFPADAGGSTDNFGLLFEKDNKLVGCVNKALAALKDSGSLAEITNKWLSENVGAPVISVG